MKNSDEMINSLFRRREQYIEEKNKKRVKAVKTATTSAFVCLVIIAGIGLWQSGLIKSKPAPTIGTTEDTAAISNKAPSTSTAVPSDKAEPNTDYTSQDGNSAQPIAKPQDDTSVIWANAVCDMLSGEEGFTQWCEKTVTFRLKDALDAGSEDNIFAILTHPYMDFDFEFEGKTLAEYYKDMANESIMYEILSQLLKEGDSLKYGEALYNGGTPSGERWVKELYDERVRYYGDELLEKYIVNGEFLKEKIEQDIIASKNKKDAQNAYNKAREAYLTSLAEKLTGEYSSEAKYETNELIIYLTKSKFAAFAPDNADGWTFDLAFRDDETAVYGVDE